LPRDPPYRSHERTDKGLAYPAPISAPFNAALSGVPRDKAAAERPLQWCCRSVCLSGSPMRLFQKWSLLTIDHRLIIRCWSNGSHSSHRRRMTYDAPVVCCWLRPVGAKNGCVHCPRGVWYMSRVTCFFQLQIRVPFTHVAAWVHANLPPNGIFIISAILAELTS